MPARKRRTGNASTRAPELTFDALEWRNIGPWRGGRVGAVAAHPNDAQTFYFGSTGGGVWKSTDAGMYWENVSDGFFKRASVGALAVAQSDPNVIYVGMGESCIRGNVSHGDGVYRSTDAGKTWQHRGLAPTRHIAKVRVHPSDPDLVYVAALGHAHGPNPERGVFRSRDGGKTWQKVLYGGPKAGASDLSMDPNNPRILYAAFWEAIRRPWELVSGGPASGLFRSTDGGDTWSDISRHNGLPRGVLGKIGVSVSPAKEGRVYAIVEAVDGAVFRSDDGGNTWERLSEEREARTRAWYYQHIIAHPTDPDTVWALNIEAWRSIDAGKTFERVAIPHGDHHDLWIDPKDPRRMINGNDGGATISLNGGEAWSSIYNQPTAEFYHVMTDTRIPYRVYSAQQDNTTIAVPSRSPLAGITRSEAYAIGGGESGYVAIRPDDPEIVFAGNYQGFMTRYDNRTGQSRNIMVWPEASSGWGAAELRHRFQWTFPIVISPHDPSVLYAGGERVFRSGDEGASWEPISPDLTRNDKTKQQSSGGPITKDNTGAEYYCTVFAFAESPRQRGVLWAGSDDGRVHVSRDDGKSWREVTPPGLPRWATIRIIEPSPHDAARAYVAAEAYRLDDFRPYLYRTTNYGRTWTKIASGIAPDDFARVIREDPERAGLLFAGTETGLYVSFDDGGRWRRVQGNLPVVPLHDLLIKDGDLVAATHGRSFWILDDITPLRQEAERTTRERVHLFAPRLTTRFKADRGFPGKPKPGKNFRMPGATMITYRSVDKPETGEKVDVFIDAGKNPPDGVVVHYWLRDAPEGEVKLTFLDPRGKEIKSFSSAVPQPVSPSGEPPSEGAPIEAVSGPAAPAREERKEAVVPKKAGLNRFVWNMRYPDATKLEGDPPMDEATERGIAGPVAAPGTYRVRLRAGEETREARFEIRVDPRVSATGAELQAQFELALGVRDKLAETHEAINAIRRMRTQIEAWLERVKDRRELRALERSGRNLSAKLRDIEGELVQWRARTRSETLALPIRLNSKLAWLSGVVGSADAAPTQGMRELFADLSKRVDAQVKRLAALEKAELKDFNAAVRREKLPPVSR